MSQPSFSYQFESERSLEEAWALLTDLNFWHQCWRKLCQQFTLSGPLRLGSRGTLILNGGEPLEILVYDFRPARSITFQLRSSKGTVALTYELIKQESLDVAVTVKLEQFSKDTQEIVSTLINPVITKHIHLFQQLIEQLQASTPAPLPEQKQETTQETPADTKKSAETEVTKTSAVDTDPTELLEDLDVRAGFRLWQLSNLWQSKIRSVLKPNQLTPTQWLLLYALVRLEKHPEPMTPTLLAKLMDLNAMLVSDVIKALVKKHLVHKIKILPDKRSFVISATAEGKITAVEAHTAVIQTDRKFFASEPLASIQKLLIPAAK